jgi:SEC-C motif domain protein
MASGWRCIAMKRPDTGAGRACPCGRPLSYAACCGRFHAGAVAPDAETLMRSRYSAFATADESYLLATWHPSTRPPALDLAADPRRWLGLEVKRHHLVDADHAEVTFVARHRRGGESAGRLQEHSRFVREDGRWYYVDALDPGS